jgi:hypothetical protein
MDEVVVAQELAPQGCVVEDVAVGRHQAAGQVGDRERGQGRDQRRRDRTSATSSHDDPDHDDPDRDDRGEVGDRARRAGGEAVRPEPGHRHGHDRDGRPFRPRERRGRSHPDQRLFHADE